MRYTTYNCNDTSRLRISIHTLAKKLEIDGEEVIDTGNLAMCVSETTDTIGFGRLNKSATVSINSKNVKEEYRDSITLPHDDDDGIRRGNYRGNNYQNDCLSVILLTGGYVQIQFSDGCRLYCQ